MSLLRSRHGWFVVPLAATLYRVAFTERKLPEMAYQSIGRSHTEYSV